MKEDKPMPWKVFGKTIYKKENGKWKVHQKCSSVEKANNELAYLRSHFWESTELKENTTMSLKEQIQDKVDQLLLEYPKGRDSHGRFTSGGSGIQLTKENIIGSKVTYNGKEYTVEDVGKGSGKAYLVDKEGKREFVDVDVLIGSKNVAVPTKEITKPTKEAVSISKSNESVYEKLPSATKSKIDSYVDKAMDKSPEEVTKLRETMLKEMGVSSSQITGMKKDVAYWVLDAYSNEHSLKLKAAYNLMKGNALNSGMEEYQSGVIKKMQKRQGENFLDKDMNMLTTYVGFNQRFIDKKFGGKIDLYRGISQEQHQELLRKGVKKGDTIEVGASVLSSFTVSNSVASSYAAHAKGGATMTIKTTVESKDIFDTFHTSYDDKYGYGLAGLKEVIVGSNSKTHTIVATVVE